MEQRYTHARASLIGPACVGDFRRDVRGQAFYDILSQRPSGCPIWRYRTPAPHDSCHPSEIHDELDALVAFAAPCTVTWRGFGLHASPTLCKISWLKVLRRTEYRTELKVIGRISLQLVGCVCFAKSMLYAAFHGLCNFWPYIYSTSLKSSRRCSPQRGWAVYCLEDLMRDYIWATGEPIFPANFDCNELAHAC